jgi:hypothetical protein
MKLTRMGWAGNTAHMEDRRGAYMILVERPEENKHLEDLGINEDVLLKWILSGMCRYRHDFFWFFIGTGGGML